MNGSPTRSIGKDRHATTALEMALVLPVFLSMLLGGLELGLMWWSNGTLQTVAAMTARCAAIGTTACADPSGYAASLARTWLPTVTIITQSEATEARHATFIVTVTTAATCRGASGAFKVVTVSASPWAGSILYPFRAATETLIACYPT
jgi:Flp pilus assembly protein TadG